MDFVLKKERNEIKEGEGLGFCFEKRNKRNRRRRWLLDLVLKKEIEKR